MKKLLLTLISIVAASMFSTALAAVGDQTTIVDQTFAEGTTLTDLEGTYTWGKELTIETNADCKQTGVVLTNSNSTSNNYEGKDFITFTKPIGSSTQELNISYDIVQSKGKGQTMTYCGINYYNENGKFVFAILEGSGNDGWKYSSELVTINENGDKSTIVLPNTHIGNGTGSTVNLTVKFSGTNVIIEIDGASYNSYSESEGIKSIKLSVNGGQDYSRYLIIKKFKVETTEVEAAQFADYTLDYVVDGTSIKTETKSGEVGSAISLTANETADFMEGDIKYIYVSDNASGKTVAKDGSTVVTLTYREAATWSYAVMSTVPSVIRTGTCKEGDKVDMAYNRYILAEDGTVWMKDATNKEYNYSFTPTSDNYVETLNYSETDMKDGLYFIEAEDINGVKIVTNNSANIRCSNSAGAYADTATEVCKLGPGKYKVKIAVLGNSGATITVKAGEQTVVSAATQGYWLDATSEEFTLTEETALTFEGATSSKPLDYILITGEEAAAVVSVAINDKDGKAVETLELTEGDIYQLSATILPANAVQVATWTSSDEKIAKVDETGKINAIAAGEATITATAGEKTATCKVTVKASTIEVTALTLDKTEATVAVEGELQLTATVEPAEANVVWTSSDEAIATVDQEGNVKAIAAGDAIITAKAGTKEATCTVTVIIPVSGITLSNEKITVEPGDEFTLAYTIAPEDATDKTIKWTSDKPAVASVDDNGKVTAVAAGEAVITATSGEQTATCTVTVNTTVAAEGATVKMTYVDMDKPNKSFGKIMNGETAQSGFNKISGGNVGWGETKYGVDYITYLQVDASAIKDNYITSATLTFDASGSTDSKRTTGWGVGYNSSEWSSTMTYASADKSITTLDSEKWTTTKSATTFEKFSFDITEAINKADGRIATILVYELAAAGGYIKNPVVEIVSTNELVYKVTFTETGEAEGVKVTVNDQDATNGISLPNGTYSFTATASHCKDYTGEFTVADKDLNVEFAITPRETWSYTVNAVDANGEFLKELSKGEGYEEENVTYYFPGYYLQDSTLLSKKHNSSNPYYGETVLLDSNNKVFEVKYDGTISDVVFYKEAEDMDEFASKDTNSAPNRCSNGLGGVVDGEVLLTTLPAGKYIIHGQVWGTKGLTAGVKIKAASEEEEDNNLWTLESTGSLASSDSEEFTLDADTNLYVYTTSGNDNRMLDYIYITGTVGIPATGITLEKSKEIVNGETVKLAATVTPANTTDAITWESSDETVATVDAEGNVTAVGIGKATITATVGEFSAECAIKCYPQKGDATFENGTTLADAIDIANYVLEDKAVPAGWDKDEWLEFYTKAADANEDTNITISDASATVSLVLEQESSASQVRTLSASANDATDNLVIGGMTTTSNGETSIAVTLDNSMDYVAVQADIYVPEGVNFDVKAGSRIADSHSFQTKRFDDNHMRVVIYTFSGNAFADNNEPLFEIVADSYLSSQNDITLVNILASDAKAHEYTLGSKYAVATGVEALGFDSNAPVKVFDLNGRYISDKVEGLEKGIYIICQGDSAKKVNIR